MPKKFKLPEKPCQLGKKFASTGEGDGDKRSDEIKFALEGLMLTSKDLDKILGEGAHARLFATDKGGAITPALGDDINELKLVHRYVDSTVTLSLDDDVITLPKAKIMSVVLQPQIGGMTWMSCDVEAPAAGDVDAIRKHSGLKIAAHLAFGQKPELDKRQKSLPLNEGEDDDGEDDAPPPKGRKGNGKSHEVRS